MPGPAAMLDVWERSLGLPVPRQVVALLAAATPGASEAEIEILPLGVRDAMLLDLRERLFGPDLPTITTCPHCSEALEASFPIAGIRLPAADPAGEPRAVEAGAHRIRFRPPATADLLAIPGDADAATARAALLERCVIEARDRRGRRVAPAALPASVQPAIAEAMAQADPQALIELHLACAACGKAFLAIFDIARFLLRELHAWAQQMLRDVDSLARAYGWREADVLALSPARRRCYLDLVAR